MKRVLIANRGAEQRLAAARDLLARVKGDTHLRRAEDNPEDTLADKATREVVARGAARNRGGRILFTTCARPPGIIISPSMSATLAVSSSS